MKKTMALFLTLVLLLAGFSAVAETADEPLTIACVHRNLLGVSGVNFRAAYYYEAAQQGAEIMFFDGNQDVQAQCDYIDDCLASDSADAFLIWTCDADGIAQTVQNLYDSEIPTVTVDIKIPADSDAFVTAGNYEMGEMCAESTAEYLTSVNGSPAGKVYVITATTQSTSRERQAGFLKGLEAYPEIEVVGTYDMPTTSVDDGAALADDLIQKYMEGSVDVYFTTNMSPMLGLISAAATYTRDDFVVLGGFDYNDVFVEDMRNGGVTYSFVAQDCFEIGRKDFQLAVAAAKGEELTEKEVFVPGQLVNMENLDAYMEDYEAKQEIIASFQ